MPYPKSIQLNRGEGWLQIEWKDGTLCQYPLGPLREVCPCVQCRGGHDKMGTSQQEVDLLQISLVPSRSYELIEILPVGNYALQPRWSDGHDTGIYTWEFLYSLCPK